VEGELGQVEEGDLPVIVDQVRWSVDQAVVPVHVPWHIMVLGFERGCCGYCLGDGGMRAPLLREDVSEMADPTAETC
jgi:hypothetical protein